MSDWTPPADAKPAESGWKPPTDAVATPDTPPFVQAPQQGPPTASSTGAATSLPAGAPSGSMAGPTVYSLPEETFSPEGAKPAGQAFTKQEVAQAAPGKKQEAQERAFFNERFAPLDQKGVTQYREQVLSQERVALKQAEQGMLADAQALEQSAAQVEQMRQAGDPAYEQAIKDHNQGVALLQKQRASYEDMARKLDRDERMLDIQEYGIKAQTGSTAGAYWNNALNSVGQSVSGLNSPMVDFMLFLDPAVPREGESQDAANNRVKERLRAGMRSAPGQIGGDSETTNEYIEELGRGSFFHEAALGATGSVPTFFMGPGGLGLMTQAMDNTDALMEGPEFDDIDPLKKRLFSSTVGAVTGQLERAGLRNAAMNKTIVGRILKEAAEQIPPGTPAQEVSRIMRREVDSRGLNAAMQGLVGGASEEAITEGAQALSENALKDAFNALEGRQVFDTPEGVEGYVTDVFRAAAQGAIGGTMYAAPGGISRAMRKEGLGAKTTPKEFEMVEALIKDPNFRESYAEQQAKDVEEGKLTPAQAEQINEDLDKATAIIDKIPDDLSPESRKQAFDLLVQREALRKKDPALVATKVEAINEKLRALEGVPKTPEPTTNQDGTTTDPKPVEPTGEEVVQTSLLPDPQAQQVDIPASETTGLGPEPVLAEGVAQVTPDAALNTQTLQEDASIGITAGETGGVQELADNPAGANEEQLAGTTEQRVDTDGQDSLGEVPVGNELVDEDQPTQQAPEAPSADVAPGVPDSPPPSRPAKPEIEDSGKGKRATTQRLIKDHPEFKDVMSERAVYYNRIPHDISRKAAEAFVEANGLDNSARAIEEGRPMPGAVRSMLGRVIMAKLRKEGELERAADFHEKWVEGITDAAQTLSALRTLYGEEYNADTILFQAQHRVNKQRDKQEESVRKKTDKVAKELRKINEEGVEEVIRTRKIRQKVSDAAEANPTERTTDPPSYGAKNKVVTKSRYQEALKRMRGQMNSGVSPEMVIVAAYHIEAGSRSFAAVAERVAKRLGKKALPYLKGAYKEAFKQLKQDGVDVGEPTSDEEINEYISKELSPQALKEGLKALDLKIDDIIRKHWTEQEDIRSSLADKFIRDAGLGKEEAESLAKAVQAEFDRITKDKKEKAIKSLFNAPTRKTAPRKVKGVEDDLIELTNLGAFSDAELVQRYGDAMGFAKLTEKDISTLQGLALEVQNAKEGRPKFDAIERLVAYEANLRGISVADLVQSVWYAHMLSGYMTHAVNFLANAFQVATETGIAMAQRPRDAKFLAKAVMRGAYKGWLEAGASFRTGTSPIRGKVEVPAALERIEDQYPRISKVLALHKYVRRAMVAADVMGYETAKELRAYQWAVKMARFETDDPSMTVRQKALDYLNETDTAYQKAKEEAQTEYDEAAKELQREYEEKGSITKKELEKKLKTAERNKKRRVFELVENERNEQVLDASGKFGARVTYNYKPEGMLGAITNGVNSVIEQIPALSYVVPFRNIIANVANEAINYTPWGFARAVSKRGSVTGSLAPEKYKQALSPKMTPEQLQQHKLDLVVKASLGIAAMTAAFFLSDPGDDDDPLIEITANGYGDWKKNMALKETGWQPYSFKIGNKWYSYQYTPLVLVFGIVGNYRDAQKYRKEKVSDTEYTQFATAMGRTLPSFLDMTFLSTVDKVLNAVSNPSGEGVMEDLMKQAERTAKTLVVPSLLTQASKEVQNLTETPQKDARGTLLGETLKDIPVLRDQYENAINALGEPIVPKTDRFISSADPDPVWNLLADKAYALQTPHPNGLTVMDGDRERVMTPKERHDYLVLRGQYIREKIEANFAKYEKMDKEKFADKMRGLTTAASKRAKKKLVLEPQDPEVMNGPWFED